MQKFTAGALAVMSLSALLLVGCSVGLNDSGGGKHTGPVTVRSSGGYRYSTNADEYATQFEFIRPNKEVFEMKFSAGTPTPRFGVGDQLGDLVYVDAGKGKVQFMKAVLDKEYVAPPSPPATDSVLYTSSASSYTCNGSSCQVNQQEPKSFYHWHDGSYRSTPDPKTKCKE